MYCIFKELKGRLLTKNSVSSTTSLKNEGEIKSFPDKQRCREFIASRPDLQEVLKGGHEHLLGSTKHSANIRDKAANMSKKFPRP